MPEANPIPFAAIPWRPTVSLALFAPPGVSGLLEGLYVLVRHADQLESLRRSFRADFLWGKPEGCPQSLPLYLLLTGDERAVARTVSCHQEIAADGVFSAGMLAAFDEALFTVGPGMYPRMFWETGVIGQVLYLEAEAARIRATGIGCFFDDEVHRILGIKDHSWQSLYHFTMGGAVEDQRIQSLDAYCHLPDNRRAGVAKASSTTMRFPPLDLTRLDRSIWRSARCSRPSSPANPLPRRSPRTGQTGTQAPQSMHSSGSTVEHVFILEVLFILFGVECNPPDRSLRRQYLSFQCTARQ